MARFFSPFRLAMQALFMAMLLNHIARSTPIHPAIKLKLQDTAQQQVTESATSTTAIQDDELAIPPSSLSLPTSVTYTKHSALSNDQSTIKASSDPGNIMNNQQKRKEEEINVETTVELSENDELKKKFKCDYPECIFSTMHKGNLKVHKRIHSGERRFRCNVPGCEYSAIRKGDLKNHMLTHSGEKPFQCDHPGCQFSSAYTGNLTKHKRTHSGEIRFHCTHPGCKYSAIQKGNLKLHEMSHTAENPFHCDYPGCEYESKQKSNLKRHKTIHNAWPF